MNRRRLVIIGVIVAVVLLGSLSTARAKQLWSEGQAKTQLSMAHARVQADLLRAGHVGLTAQEIAPFRAQLHGLEQAHAPGSSLLWDSATVAFYQQQSDRYQTLGKAIQAKIGAVTTAAHAEATRQLKATQNQINHARNYGVDSTFVSKALAAQTAAFHRATTPARLRAISWSLRLVRRPLHQTILTRQKYVQSALATAHNSAASIDQVADNEAASGKSQLQLLSLISTHEAGYGPQIDSLLSQVHAQTSPFAAAVKEAGLHDLLQQLSTTFQKTIPEKMVVVSTENQSATMYQNGQEVYSAPVTTGGPELPTDLGVFHIYFKASPFVFHSPFPVGSPYYYYPTPVQYWMPFDGAEGLHDASWRSNFGPGSNLAPTDLGTGNYILGTHGCVNLPTDAAAWLWDWAPVGTTVVVI